MIPPQSKSCTLQGGTASLVHVGLRVDLQLAPGRHEQEQISSCQQLSVAKLPLQKLRGHRRARPCRVLRRPERSRPTAGVVPIVMSADDDVHDVWDVQNENIR